MHRTELKLSGLTENNLKSIDVVIPHNQLTVITGPSGSGKSSLAFDVLFREGQRRMMTDLSISARQMTSKMKSPAATEISGMRAALALGQNAGSLSDRSTIGTFTNIYDDLRLLFARLGKSELVPDIKMERSLFSFNHKKGACPDCNGLGCTEFIDSQKLIADAGKTIRQGAFVMTTPSGYIVYSQVTMDVLNDVCNAHGFHVDIPWEQLKKEEQDVVLFGSTRLKVPFGKHTLESRMKWSGITAKPREDAFYPGIIPTMEDILRRDRNGNILRFVSSRPCESCGGQRLNKVARSVMFDEKGIHAFVTMSISELAAYFSETNTFINHPVYQEITADILAKAHGLLELGLGHLHLSDSLIHVTRSELQRMRLAQQIISGLSGLIYVLDEPSAGVHPQENEKIIRQLFRLRDMGNTVIVVEHNIQNIVNADFLIDLGPGGGSKGGKLIFQGTPSEMLRNQSLKSLTRDYLLKKRPHFEEENVDLQALDICVDNFPAFHLKKNALNVITGPSGNSMLDLLRILKEKKDLFDGKILHMDQNPIGRTVRSNPATYTKLFDKIRALYAALPEAKSRGLKSSDFSFNNKGGRCEHCKGAGLLEIGMHFMENVHTPCPYCKGKRFQEKVLQVRFLGKDIAQILDLTVEEAVLFFESQPKILKFLRVLQQLGLGYIRLGQAATRISGGEAQRLKLAAALVKASESLVLLEFPCTGLHMDDVTQLVASLRKMAVKGNTFLVIENHMDFLSAADHIIELHTDKVFEGAPGQMLAIKNSLTYSLFARREKMDFQIAHTADSHASDPISMKGVSTHNLKYVDIEIPLGTFAAITGPSGSGKSSLAFDTIMTEGRYRFLSNFSVWMRSRIKGLQKGSWQKCTKMIPAIGIGRNSFKANPRSTAATHSGVYDMMRLLYSRIGRNGNRKNDFLASDFSFNNDIGACPQCKGLSFIRTADPEKLISNPELSVFEGALKAHKTGRFYGDKNGKYLAILSAVEESMGLDFHKPWDALSDGERDIIMYGLPHQEFEVEWNFQTKTRTGTHKFRSEWPGFVSFVNEEYERKHAGNKAEGLESLMSDKACDACGTYALRPEVLQVCVDGLHIGQMADMEANKLLDLCQKYLDNGEIPSHPPEDFAIARELLKLLASRLEMICMSGLDYLPLSRRTRTLSGGELQRLRIAAHASGQLQDVLYVLDEPTAGLHPEDAKKIIQLLQNLRNLGNTVLVVEHNMDLVRQCDLVFDMGPGGGSDGGEIIAQASPREISSRNISPSASWLDLRYKPMHISNSVPESQEWMSIKSAHANNLKNIDVRFPVGRLCLISGLSGSGKTSLLRDVIYKSVSAGRAKNCESMEGFGQHCVSDFEQKAAEGQGIVGTYSQFFDDIRILFAMQEAAKNNAFTKTHFSLFAKGGRCEICKGQGSISAKLDFLSDAAVLCDECKGKRFQKQMLQIEYQGKNIADVLAMSVKEACVFFAKEKGIHDNLQTLCDAGLGYLHVGQASKSLSSGEKQRLLLCNVLNAKKKEQNLILLDEPSRGLHPSDVASLLKIFSRLVHEGNSLIISDHHPLIFQTIDYLVELGPKGGSLGGKLMRSGFVG